LIEALPTVNATLNGTCALLLCAGFLAIRGGRKELHRRLMIAAFLVSVAFLTSYVVYHANHGSTPFPGQGAVRVLYFAILIPHTVLAAAVVPLVVLTLRHALRGRFDRHRKIARWTLPIWLFVSVTGVAIYLMLYRLPV